MKHYKIILHPVAETELLNIYRGIADIVSPAIALKYISGIRQFIENLETFPERGTIKESIIPNLRVVGYKRSASIAFTVFDKHVLVLGIFARGREIHEELLKSRL